MKIIHGALLFAPLAFFIVMYSADLAGNQEDKELNDILIIVFPVIAASSLLISSLISKSRLKAIDLSQDLNKKLQAYLVVVFTKNAPKEFGALLLGVGFLLTNNELFLALGAVMVVTIFFDRPTALKVKADLQLSDAEYRQLI